jgi:hypothetical protein
MSVNIPVTKAEFVALQNAKDELEKIVDCSGDEEAKATLELISNLLKKYEKAEKRGRR